MSYASGTTHYNLPQTVGSDKRDWTDTNQAFSDIDAAIYGAVQGASAATSAIETINGEIETITEKQAVDEGNISTLAGKVSTLESTVGTQGAAIADVRQDLQDNIESKREASATSTHAYEIGDTFYYNDVLYKATAQIAIGGTIVPSTNCTAVTVMSELQAVASEVDKGSVSITTTGAETIAAFLNRLYAAADISKINSHSRLVYKSEGVNLVFHIETYGSSIFFVRTGGSNTNDINVRAISLDASNSTWHNMSVSASGFSGIDQSSNATSSGSVIELIY